jgi:glycyl-tRNA synthetase
MPGENLKWYSFWKDYCMQWLINFGINNEHLRLRDHSVEELSHYSKATCDIEYQFPFGWGELWGIADRGNYDLTQHMTHSKESLEYLDQENGVKIIPNVVEPAVGCDRLLLMALCDAYDEEVIKEGDTRVVLRLHPYLAPYKVCVMPLSKQLGEGALGVFNRLTKQYMCEYDETGSIGKRYRRQDAIGTPLCVTYDFDSINDDSVTIRFRDSMEQKRIKIADLEDFLEEYYAY